MSARDFVPFRSNLQTHFALGTVDGVTRRSSYHRLGYVLAAIAIAASVLTIAPVSTVAAPASAQVTPLDDEPDEAPNLGRITGSPDPGPAPEDAGDRGGLIQLGLAAVLFSGLIFIATRIRAETIRNRSGHKTEGDKPR